MTQIVSSQFKVSGVRTVNDVRDASQALFDIFSEQGLGQASFEVTGDGPADLIVKHKADVAPDRAAIDAALRSAGDFHVVD